MKLSAKKSWKKFSFFALFLFLVPDFFTGCYVSTQAFYHLKNRWNQIPLEEAAQQPENAEYKDLFKTIPEIKNFAETEVGLKKSDNYTTYLKVEGSGITYNLTASDQLAFKPYTWWFPFVGTVPYKGYFNAEDMLEEKNELVEEGYDVWVFPAAAYSSLGYFKDPINTIMLKNGLVYLSDIIIHEMTHATLYVPGETKFNEQLASFVGKTASEEFLKNYPGGLQLLEEKHTKEKRYREFKKIMKDAFFQMNQIYKNQDFSVTEKTEFKKQYFTEIQDKIIEIYPNASKRFLTINNARLLQYKRYDKESEIFQTIWENGGKSWRVFWKTINGNLEKIIADVNKSHEKA